MKINRKTIKRGLEVDLVIQLLIIVFAIAQLFLPTIISGPFIIVYFGLGGAQLLSFLIHLKWRIQMRMLSKPYLISLLIVFFLGAISLYFGEFVLVFLFFMLPVGLAMAVYYLNYTYNNYKTFKYEE